MAHAQTDYIRIETIGWTFAPALGDDGSFLGFLSWVEDGSLTGLNVGIIWHEVHQDGSFAAWAWNHDDLGLAAKWIRESYADDVIFIHDPDVVDAISYVEGIQAIAPKWFLYGLFADDPFQIALANATDPAALAQLLSDIGYPAAPEYSVIAAAAASGGGAVGIGGRVPVECIEAAGGSEELAMLHELQRRTLLIIDEGMTPEQAAAGNCSWPCTCVTEWGSCTPTGSWTALPSIPLSGGGTNCRWQRTSTYSWSKAGETWLLCNDCAANGTVNRCDKASDIILPGATCPTTPPADAVIVNCVSCEGP